MGRLEKRHVEPSGNPPLITGMPLFSSPTLPPPITPIPTGPYSAGGVSIGPSTPFSPQYTHSTPPNIGQPNLPYFQSPPPYTSPLFTNPSNIQPRLPKLEVPMFSGDNVREWLFQLTRFFEYHQTPPNHRLHIASFYMSGLALLWLHWMFNTGQISTWEAFVRDVTVRFGPSSFKNHEASLFKLRQTATVETYINDQWYTPTSCSPHPQSNGVVERKNRTLQEMSRTMLNEQSLPQKFWCNAVGNLLLTILECLEASASFLGYSQNSKAYIILNKHTRKIKESLNVTFDETPPPSKTSPLVDDDLDEEEAIREIEKKNLENVVEDETLEIDKIVNIKESRNHPLENVIGNLNQRTLRSQAQNQSNFYCFISTLEPKNVNEALGDESWIVAMQEELNQFIANDVWELVPQPKNMTIIGTKWVFRNKLDENGVVSRNKARLVAQGYNQQEGIDYDETYAPVARLESIRILLAYACALDFKLFQMDVKSAFLNGFINEEKQIALAISTTEAEYVSAGKACQQALWMKQDLIDYDVRLDDVPIMCDNKGAIDLSKNPVQHSRTKHIEIRHHFLRDNVQKGHVSIEKVPSVDNIADILTKPLKCVVTT
ncbi:retrovirus-related pol polyprotein from transposon TNT 1-94 [Tanacetum coccineum]